MIETTQTATTITFEEYTAFSAFEFLSKVMLNSEGISMKQGILYAWGPFVKSMPSGE